MSLRERIILFIMGLAIFCCIWVVAIDSFDRDAKQVQVQTQLERLEAYYDQLSEKALTQQEQQVVTISRTDIAEAPFLDELRPVEYRRKMAQSRKKELANMANESNVSYKNNASEDKHNGTVADNARQTEGGKTAAEFAMIAEVVRKKVACSGTLSFGDQKMVVLNGREYAAGEVVRRVEGGAIVVDEIRESRVWLSLKNTGRFANQRIEIDVPEF